MMWSIVVQAFKYSSENSGIINPETSLHDFFANKVGEVFPGEDQERQRKTVIQMAEFVRRIRGKPGNTTKLEIILVGRVCKRR
jgi:hypothetical protein